MKSPLPSQKFYPRYHPGGFAFQRKFDIHTGIDLYGSDGDEVFAIYDGIVVDKGYFTGPLLGHKWWNTTFYVTIQHGDIQLIYGEIAEPLLQLGQKVKSGEKIGTLVPVLPEEKLRFDIPKHSVTMLHLECLKTKNVIKPFGTNNFIPDFLISPEPILQSLGMKPIDWHGKIKIAEKSKEIKISEHFFSHKRYQFHEDEGVVENNVFTPIAPYGANYSLSLSNPRIKAEYPEFVLFTDQHGLTRKIRGL